MAQEQGAAGSGEEEPDATGSEVHESPEMWGNNGLVGDGRYRMTHRLGRGGMAEVFAAEDVRLGRVVAVKLLRADLAEDPVSKARFTREAQSVAGLNHHAVVAVYDSGEEAWGGNVVPYIVMELVEGSTIRELLVSADGPPTEQALIIVSGVLEALAYSHQHGIVHRDIKPANVIITETGSVKVMDFGIARALHGAASTMTQTGMVMGTPQYLSPEQALGKTVDNRSDLYAVGCLLYELLALRPPFTGETPLSVVYQHVQDMPRVPSEASGNAPPELDGLVMRSLAKDPDDRFQSAEEMRALVQYALRMLDEHGSHTGGLWNTGSVEPDTTPPMGIPAASGDTPTGQLGPPLLLGHPDGDGGATHADAGGNRRGTMILIAVLAVVAVAGGALLAVSLREDDPPPPPVETEAPPTTESEEEPEEPDDPPEETPEDEAPDELPFSPDDPGFGSSYDPGTPTETDYDTPTETETPPTDPEGNVNEGDPDGDDNEGGDPGDDDTGDPGGDPGGESNGDPGGEPGGSDPGEGEPPGLNGTLDGL